MFQTRNQLQREGDYVTRRLSAGRPNKPKWRLFGAVRGRPANATNIHDGNTQGTTWRLCRR